MEPVALGFRAHSGWATMTALAGPSSRPRVVLRRRVELADDQPRQPFHAAEGRPLPEARRLIARSTADARRLARRAFADAARELSRSGLEVASCGLVLASGTRALPTLDRILASHALIHAAEGELFRDAIREAARRRGVRAIEVRERDIVERASTALGVAASGLRRRLDEMGRALGPPWRQDEKLATLVAWLALEG